ncbi:MAG TPA: alanine racemase [Thermoanaerobaculia bacterium]|jgi:diaminopimelate decarboxylase|nr:alanine racemase [Thermoanaerobaculia bacterium]
MDVLRRIAAEYGTPAYAYDIGRIRRQIERAHHALPAGASLLYSLKANPNLSICAVMAAHGVGADVVSASEIMTALSAGISPANIFVSGPYHSPEVLELARTHPGMTLSVDSLSELRRCSAEEGAPVLLRLRPDYKVAACMPAGHASRFGIGVEELAECDAILRATESLDVRGFHVFAGSQILDAGAVVSHLEQAVALACRAADELHLVPTIVNLGGGFGVPYGSQERELDLDAVAAALERVAARIAPARLAIELGRYLVAQAGWYLTTVVATRPSPQSAVVVDGGSHQRADLCEIGLCTTAQPPVVLNDPRRKPLAAVDVLGCLCLPTDVLAEGAMLPPLTAGDILAFPNAGAYGLTAAPTHFLSHASPPEIGFEDDRTAVVRPRGELTAWLGTPRNVFGDDGDLGSVQQTQERHSRISSR